MAASAVRQARTTSRRMPLPSAALCGRLAPWTVVRCECGDHRQRHLGARVERLAQDVLVRVVGAAAARAEAVDGERYVRRHVARLAGAAALRSLDRAADALCRLIEQVARRLARAQPPPLADQVP